LFKDCESSPSPFFHCECEAVVLNEHANLLDVCLNDLSILIMIYLRNKDLLG